MRLKWIDHPGSGRLCITPRPDGNEALDAQLAAWSRAGVRRVVSMLEPHEAEMLGLSEEGAVCARHGMVFHNFPVVDHGTPDSVDAIRDLLIEIGRGLDAGERIAIHCRAALGRAPLIACCTLISRGVNVDEAILSVGHARKAIVPETDEQAQFIRDFAAAIKNRPLLAPVAA
jgi:Predicted protein-tyrosine phosphatase